MPSKPLTPKQEAFVREYLVDLNATQSAIRAGYSAKTAESIGLQLLRKTQVAAAIAQAKAKRAERVEVTADYVLRNLTEVVERCLQRAPVMGRRGGEVVHVTDDEGRHVWQFDAKGANGALNLLGQHLGLYTKKHEHTGAAGGPVDLRIVHEVVDPAA
jgi:phage terminase small subunit